MKNFKGKIFKVFILTIGTLLFTLPSVQAKDEVEIFSWWSSGGELAGLYAITDVFQKRYPGVEVVNAAIGGGDGTNMKTVLETRMLSGEPPDSFQVWGGAGVINDHVIPGRMEPLDWLYEDMRLYELFPQSVIDTVSYQGRPYVVPVNIHRGNNLWFRPDRLAKVGYTEPPGTWKEMWVLAEKLKKAGIPAFVYNSSKGAAFHTLYYFLVGSMDSKAYLGLFDGSGGWDGPGVTKALERFNKMVDYTWDDYQTLNYSESQDRFILESDLTPAMWMMGDWAWGNFKAKKKTDKIKWGTIPGHQNKYVWICDSFGLPKNAPNRTNALAFLQVIGSRAGRDAFNPNKGSIPARTDGDVKLYDEYLSTAMKWWTTQELIPFIGGLAKQSFVTDASNIGFNFISHRNVARFQKELVLAAQDAGYQP